MLRDPVERYRSGIAPELKRSREHGQNALSTVIANHTILHSMYHWQVKRALEVLGTDRVLVLQYERCVEDPLAQMQRTQRFVGLEPLAAIPPALHLRVPPVEKPELPARFRSELSQTLADDVRQLAALCPELDLGLWPNFARV
jgi:Sulfotransferase domain